MARVVIQAVVSVDGYIAYPDDTVGPLFDWYGNGDVTVHVNDKWPFHVSRASADYVQPFWDAIKVTVIGRHLFDTTDGWAGVPAAGDGTSVSTLSVDNSNSGSSCSIRSPGCLSHLPIVPSDNDSPI